MINALASLDLLYGIPLMVIASHRGVEGEQMIGQVPMGRLTEPLLRAMEIESLRSNTSERKERPQGSMGTRTARPEAGRGIAKTFLLAMILRRIEAILLSSMRRAMPS